MSVMTTATVAATNSVMAPIYAMTSSTSGVNSGIDAGHEVHAGSDHGGGVDQGADRRRALHRVGQPHLQRELRRLADAAEEQSQARDDEQPVRHVAVLRCRGIIVGFEVDLFMDARLGVRLVVAESTFFRLRGKIDHVRARRLARHVERLLDVHRVAAGDRCHALSRDDTVLAARFRGDGRPPPGHAGGRTISSKLNVPT